MPRHVSQTHDFPSTLAAVAPRASLSRRALAIVNVCTDTLFAPYAIESAAAALPIARDLYARASQRWASPLPPSRGRDASAASPIASAVKALALIGAGSRSFDRIIRDRRIHDRSERP